MTGETDLENKLHLSDAIDYDRDIAPYRFVNIISGVGSGKNFFIDRLIKGDNLKHSDGTLVSPKHILLITSRKAKVNEQLKEETVVYDPVIGVFDSAANDWLIYDDPKYDDYFESPRRTIVDSQGFGKYEIYLRSCVNTNAKVEWNLRQNFLHCDKRTHPWERFDIIVVDEVHAILADASYQSAPFYVRRLIEETLKRSETCKVITMTGSPQIIGDHPLFAQAHTINLMDICKKVVPKRVEFITKDEAEAKQKGMLERNEKFVAFFNHIGDILALEEEYSSKVAISFSDQKRLKKLENDRQKSYEKMLTTQNYIAVYQELPDDVIAFLSTSRNKEGINLKNTDIRVMFVESHVDIDVIQMAGRLREPIDVLYVVADSIAHHDMESRFEPRLSQRADFLESINTDFKQLAQNEEYIISTCEPFRQPVCSSENLESYLDYIHGKFPYIRYDYFSDEFVFYPERVVSKQYYATQRERYANAVLSRKGLMELVSAWYPGVPCTISKGIQMDEETRSAIHAYLTEKHWLDEGKVTNDKDRAEILQALNVITGNAAKTLGPALKKYGFSLVHTTRSKKSNAPMRIIESIAVEGDF